ncbi:MAG: acyl carrier protein [Gammaproteobacteria bacterium]|nr:acyl carrier protein [Gammaproteobacteria bacterium]
MALQTNDENKLAKILVEALDLEDIKPENIDPEAPLFGFEQENSLGLDSIDALEIALAISKNYGIQLKAENENNREVFANLRALSNHITAMKM